MCGIAGVLHFDGTTPPREILHQMIRMVNHRGPDGTGIHLDGASGLAHARLSIIDLAGGTQPMQNEDSTLWITFNGEIFNYLELREDLLARGHRFRTSCDTEVILHLYEEKGADCVRYLNGQWSFAIWNSKDRSLFLSRDRLGVRPLFYTVTNRKFVFGSEIKAIFAHPEVGRELDPSGLDQVFTYWCTVAPKTVFKNILELPPGHSMRVQDGNVTVCPHWVPAYEPEHSSRNGMNERDYADQLRELLIDATRIRLRADVPVGAYLSGGLDSTLTTALIRQFTSSRLRTFSVTFEDAEFDE
ncbi:MAG TPA: asparagine synthase (glutamine-hydrolyzing), partial [Chthoniobacterales bacterium]